MTLPVYAYGSTSKGSHPSEWKKDGTDSSYSVLKNAVLQFTDLGNNNNKFYSLEIQQHSKGSFRLFSHYGRTDDLANRDSAGQKECRYADQFTIDREYQKIIKSKLRKGYLEVSLAKSKIGSDKARGNSSGELDEHTVAAINQKTKPTPGPQLEPELSALVKLIYQEAGQALTAQTAIKITAEGFETPLGILTLGQVEKGFDLIAQLRQAIMDSKPTQVKDLSGTFYSTIPHKIGRTKAAIESAAIDTIEKSDTAEETLQLMKDMLSVNAAGGVNLFAADEDYQRYQALNTTIQYLPVKDKDRKRIEEFVVKSQHKTHRLKPNIRGIYTVCRAGELDKFNPRRLNNIQELFHGTRSQNIVGIMTRGLLLPNQAKRYGAVVTGAMLGSGIYFADCSSKSLQYCRASAGQTGFMFVTSVALGKMKEFTEAQPHLVGPPDGFDSVAGIASVKAPTWGRLMHNEYVVYDLTQQRLDYLVEFVSNN